MYLEFDIMKNALWVDPADQSLWFYYQFLLTTIISPPAYDMIVLNFSDADRIKYLDQQLIFLNDLLDGAEDSKWIYNALIDCTTAMWEIRGRQNPPEVKRDLVRWLNELQKLDPLRGGRWHELKSLLNLEDL
jgi:geranylgeranyl transferase type-2 subunit alpha